MGKSGGFQTEALFDAPQSATHSDEALVPSAKAYHVTWPAYDEYRRRPARPEWHTFGLLQFAPQMRPTEATVEYIVSALNTVDNATVVLPEFFLSSYSNYHDQVLDRRTIANLLLPLQRLSEANTLRLVGSLPMAKPQGFTNGVVVINDGRIDFPTLAKEKLFGGERDTLVPKIGNARSVSLGGVSATVQVCMDIIDPLPTRRAVDHGARVILGPSAVSVDFLRTIHRARSLENQVVSIFCNRTGVDVDGTIYLGRSAIFLPDGTELTASSTSDELLISTVDMSYVTGYKQRFGI